MTEPFDQHDPSGRDNAASSDPDVTTEFWGATPGWRSSGSTPRIRRASRPGASRSASTPLPERSTPAPLSGGGEEPLDPDWDDADWIVERVMQRSAAAAEPAPVDRSELAELVDATPELDVDRGVRVERGSRARRGSRDAVRPIDADRPIDEGDHGDDVPVGGLVGWFERTGIFGPARPPRTGRTPVVTAERTRTHRQIDAGPPVEPTDHRGASGAVRRPARSSGRPAPRASDGPVLGSVDPLLVRLGVIIAIGVLLVPLALALRPSSGDETVRSPDFVASGGPRVGADRPVTVDRVVPPTAPDEASSGDGAAEGAVSPQATSAGDSDTTSDASDAGPPPCDRTYTIHPGDYWLRLADEADVDLADLLFVNGATVDTVLHPGDEVCLPRGAFVPSPPTTTTTPPTTAAPATTAAPSPQRTNSSSGTTSGASSGASSGSSSGSSTATTRPPTTTAAPPTTAAAPRPSASGESPEQVKAIIREVWPEEHHDRAILVAQRESSLRPGAYNGHCCYGVFQIYWNVHRSWLTNHGVTTSAHLLDARTNIEMAYLIFQRSGWSPWSQTAY